MNETRLVLASGNSAKANELTALLAGLDISVRAQSAFGLGTVAETGLSFIENALIKARHAALHTGLPALADDSGLAVDALGGAPGIYSARYAGDPADDQANLHKLLQAMRGIPWERRGACFHCAVVYLRAADDATPLLAQGQWRGRIATEARGDQGFGYDPVFYLPPLAKTAAQLPAGVKNRLSHRARALAQLRFLLAARYSMSVAITANA